MLLQLQYNIIFVKANAETALRIMRILPQKMPGRIVVYAKDVMNMTGRKERAAQLLLQKIRQRSNKPKDAFITVREFSLYTGIDEDLVWNALLD